MLKLAYTAFPVEERPTGTDKVTAQPGNINAQICSLPTDSTSLGDPLLYKRGELAGVRFHAELNARLMHGGRRANGESVIKIDTELFDRPGIARDSR